MSAAGIATVTVSTTPSDTELVASVRAGDDAAFEELYRRYRPRIAIFVRRIVRDEERAEDVAQEAFFSALRRMRATDSEIVFKPWIYEIARNAAIDSYRRTSRAEEISIDAAELRSGDRRRLVGYASPDATLVAKQRIEHLRGALDELSETHHRILVMRELEGLSYREIGERLELTRPAVESTLFRARRRLEHEYEELDTGRRCESMGVVIARLSNGLSSDADERRLARHARRCPACRKQARELGVEPLPRRSRIATRAAALLPIPGFLRRRGSGAGSGSTVADSGQGAVGTLVGPGAQLTAAVSERAAALVAAAAIAGAGGAMLAGVTPRPLQPHGGTGAPDKPAAKQKAPSRARISKPHAPSGPRGARKREGVGSGPTEKRTGASHATPPAKGATGAGQPPRSGSGSAGLPGMPDLPSGSPTGDDTPGTVVSPVETQIEPMLDSNPRTTDVMGVPVPEVDPTAAASALPPAPGPRALT